MRQDDIRAILTKQRAFFASGATLPVGSRVQALKRLRHCLRRHEGEIQGALEKDLGKSAAESYLCEVGLTYHELTYLLRHVKSFASARRVQTSLAQFPARCYTKPSPYGVVLVMSPWNYPFLLTMEPLLDALAAGNTVVLKPSAYSPNTSAVMARIIGECFPPDYVAVVTGGREENRALLQEKFDYIFFTGSQAVGREVMTQAARHLTPVTLELGGKSPCLVERTADLKLAARRIVFGKFLNCGQTCVAPDYLYCDKAVKDDLIFQLKVQIQEQFGVHPLKNPDYGKIINQKHFDRLCGLISEDKVVFGGERERDAHRIAPTILDGVSWDDPVMGEEIFGPLLPILTFDCLEEAVENVNRRPHPLALYLFTQDKASVRFVTDRCLFGGGCVNDTVLHLATPHMGFGGVGDSGMGAYHGKVGFDTFSHPKSIVDKPSWLDVPLRYQPYCSLYQTLLRMILR
jgi:aldehyde dehydrogenase (NAD+)